jgi:ABC-type multidrug transport system fused ATPase/permease subunit
MDKKDAMYLLHSKSMFLGIFLTLFFGCFGLLYSSIVGGLIMCFICSILVTLFLCNINYDVNVAIIIIYIILQIFSIIWTVVAISIHNRKLLLSIINDNTTQHTIPLK